MVKIIGARPQLLGDTVFTEVILNFWKNKHPNSQITWVLASKCKQGLKFWEGHPHISSILISDDSEGNIYTIEGKTYNQKTDKLPFDIKTPDFNPPAPTDISYNTHNCVELAWRMAGLDLKDYYALPPEQQRPRLYSRTKPLPYQNFVSIWPTAGYGKGTSRSPSKLWWKAMVDILIKKGYSVSHFGHSSEPRLSNEWNYYYLATLPLFEQVNLAANSEVSIGTDSGSHWLLGSYDACPLINLLTYHMPGHSQNPCALAPMQYSNKQINLFHPTSCSHISHEDVPVAIKELSK